VRQYVAVRPAEGSAILAVSDGKGAPMADTGLWLFLLTAATWAWRVLLLCGLVWLGFYVTLWAISEKPRDDLPGGHDPSHRGGALKASNLEERSPSSFVAFRFFRPDGSTFVKAISSDDVAAEVTVIARTMGAVDAFEIKPSAGDVAVRTIAKGVFWLVFLVGCFAIGRWLIG